GSSGRVRDAVAGHMGCKPGQGLRGKSRSKAVAAGGDGLLGKSARWLHVRLGAYGRIWSGSRARNERASGAVQDRPPLGSVRRAITCRRDANTVRVERPAVYVENNE